MKYFMQTFGPVDGFAEGTVSKEWITEMIQFMHRLDEDLRKSGELVDAQGLAWPNQAKTVRFTNGKSIPTDGPFAEAKEALVGYWVLDVENEARAIEIASRVVDYIKHPIELRQIMDAPPEV